jgi:PadR family transcriptional regulator, regulatory protein PadR
VCLPDWDLSEQEKHIAISLTICKTVYMNPNNQELPRLSPKEKVILELLTANTSMYGLQLVSQSQGKLKRGTVYVTLGRMEEKGLILSEPEKFSDHSGLVSRRMYRPTSFGLRVLEIWMQLAQRFAWETGQ